MSLIKAPAYTHSYVGRDKCGCVVAVVADYGTRRDVAQTVAEFIKDGLTVERVTREYVKEHFGCTCPKPVQEAMPL